MTLKRTNDADKISADQFFSEISVR